MKKIVITSLCLSLVFLLHAQTEQGRVLVTSSSNLSFSSQKVDGVNDNSNTLSLNGGAGYFVIDNLAAGLLLGINNNSQGDFKFNSFSVGPYARYYINGIFIGAGFSLVKTKFDDGTTETKSDGNQIRFEGGYALFLNDNVSVEPSLGFTIGGGDIFDGTSIFGLNVGFSIYLP